MATTMQPLAAQPPAMPPAQNAPPAAPAPGTPAPRPLTPQQMQQMQLVVKQCMQVLLTNQTSETIIKKCQLEGDAPKVIADLVAPLLAKVNDSARRAGANVDMVTMMVAGVEVIGKLAEMLWHAGVIKSEQEVPQFIAQASALSIQRHNNDVQQLAQAGAQQPGAAQAPPTPPAAGGMISQPGA